MKKQNTIYLGIGIVAVVLIVAIVLLSDQEKEEDTIKVGLILPLTGTFADVGINNLEAIKLAIKEINTNKSSKSYQLIVEDSKGCDASESISAMQRLINVEGVKYVYSICSGVILATQPIAEENEILHLGCAGSPQVAKSGSYMFNFNPSESYAMSVAADYLLNKEHLKIAIINCDNEWCITTKNQFKNYFEQRGGEVAIEKQIITGTSDLRTEFLQILNINPDAIFVSAYPSETITIFKQAKELGFDKLIFGAPTWFDSNLAAQTKDFSENKQFIVQHNAYDDTFANKMNNNVLLGTPQAYDAINVLSKVIHEIESEETSIIRDYLFEIDYEGQSGHIEFDKEGNIVGAYYDIVQFNNGTFNITHTKLSSAQIGANFD